MKLKQYLLPPRFFLLVLVIPALLTGCGLIISDSRYDTVSVPEEPLTQIQAFDWQTMSDPGAFGTTEEVVTVDPDAAELPLTLDQCRAMVLQNNLDLKVQQFYPEIAEESVSEARAAFEPLAFSSFNFYKS